MPSNNDTLNEVLASIRSKNTPIAQVEAQSRFQDEVLNFLKERFPKGHERVGEPLIMGSKKKGTDTCIASDIDILVPFKHGYKGGPKAMKQELYKALRERFPNPPTIVRLQRVSVGLRRPFGNGIMLEIDIVPGMEISANSYKEEGGTNNEQNKYLYLFDEVKQEKLTTNVHAQIRLIKEKMGPYREIVRLLKAWRENAPISIGSYALELLVYQAAVAKNAPKNGSPEVLLRHVLQHNIPFLSANGSLQDIGANYLWDSYMKAPAKKQLADMWKKLLLALDGREELKSFFI